MPQAKSLRLIFCVICIILFKDNIFRRNVDRNIFI